MKKQITIVGLLIILLMLCTIFNNYKQIEILKRVNKNLAIENTNYKESSKKLTSDLKELYNIEFSITTLNKRISQGDKIELTTSVYKYSKLYNYNPYLMLSIGFIESTFNKYAISSANCRSIFQVNPDVHNVNMAKIHEIPYNTKWGFIIFDDKMKRYKNNLILALNSYNGWVSPKNPYAEKVLSIYDRIKDI